MKTFKLSCQNLHTTNEPSISTKIRQPQYFNVQFFSIKRQLEPKYLTSNIKYNFSSQKVQVKKLIGMIKLQIIIHRQVRQLVLNQVLSEKISIVTRKN